jgi:two-component system, cell cycle sensor histidine kinase and response regulator CckA
LAQVYGIVRQHEGYIEVSTRHGQGTSFFVFLPALESPQPRAEEISEISSLQGLGETILIVEDDQATREALQSLLEARQYHVIVAQDGQEAVQLFQQMQGEIQLVVSDMVMPRMGGLELYHTLRSRWPEVQMLLMTGHPLDLEAQNELGSGEVHWLQKPFPVQEFHQAVRKLLDQ